MVGGKHALVVVACLFAGVGAWGATVTVSPNPTYASELFGPGHGSPAYPKDMTPRVTLTIPGNIAAFNGDHDSNAATPNLVLPARNHDGSAEVTFTLIGGTLDANVTGLMWSPTGMAADRVVAPGTVASIVSGGRKGNTHVTIKIEAATKEDDTAGAAGDTARSRAETGRQSNGMLPTTPIAGQTISFEMPRLADVGVLAGANAKAMVKSVTLRAESVLISGAFTNTYLTGNQRNGFTAPVIHSRDAVTLGISDPNTKTIAIDDDAAKGLSAFMSVKEKNAAGYVELATVTVTASNKHVTTPAKAAVGAMREYQQGTLAANGTFTPGSDPDIVTPASDEVPEDSIPLHDMDGSVIDAGLRGNLMVNAMGTRDLFNDGDMLFIDYDGNKKMGGSEAIVISDDMGTGSALSIDPDTSDSFKGGVGSFTVYYMPGGKAAINHEAMINLTAMVDYSDPSAMDEAPAKTSTTLKFDGVGGAVMAYAIPHSTNGTGDKGNVRVRCEASAGCRVFLECWDDMGMRGFGEAPMIAGNNVMVWNGEAIEGVTGMEPTSRHSCRVLSKGMVTVQQLTRDGNSGTLVNNTYVGGGM